jgi:GH15 family glucan-1,4-alpha-glucosidase
MTLDASLVALWYFEVFPPQNPLVKSTMEAVRERLWVNTPIGGLARYENDYYHQVEQTNVHSVPGNPWFICTLWWAQYLIACAEESSDLQEALTILEWVADHALPSGVLAEQVHPYTGEPLSVSPLTWSHAEYVVTAHKWLEKHHAIERASGVRSPPTG